MAAGHQPGGRVLDLNEWGPSLRPMIMSVFGAEVARCGIDLDEVVQQTALRVLLANQGARPYDPTRSAPTTYLMLQARSALWNLNAKQGTRRRYEHTGVPGLDGVPVDAATVAVAAPDVHGVAWATAWADLEGTARRAGIPLAAVHAYVHGATVDEMAAQFDTTHQGARWLRERIRRALRQERAA